VTGDISYGEIELERGAQITGKLSVRERSAQSSGQGSAQRGDTRRNAA
jgi:cytoskeletal protein CcmA (bactofilin family)